MKIRGISRTVSLAILVIAASFIGADVVSAEGPELPAELSHIRFEGGNGTSLEQAVVVLNAESTKEGVAAENLWIKWKYKGSKKVEQQLSSVEDRHYDVVTIEVSSGARVDLWFDITEFFGKW
ncbi:MAG: hypothetical protein GY906_09860 [bacterium]|nr:hypothetical protein [bacterium]